MDVELGDGQHPTTKGAASAKRWSTAEEGQQTTAVEDDEKIDASANIDHIGVVEVTPDMLQNWERQRQIDDNKAALAVTEEGMDNGGQENIMDDDNGTPVLNSVECTEGEGRPFWKRHRRYILVGICLLLIIGVAVGVGVLLGSNTNAPSSVEEVFSVEVSVELL